jgi:putative hydrolase of the HAD superfamily
MDRISERGQAELKATAASAIDQKQWIVIGAGRLGRGFLNLVANEQGFRSLLFVKGVNTPQKEVDEFNTRRKAGDGYNVIVVPNLDRKNLQNYEFMTTIDTGLAIEQIANSNTQVISTSVGLDKLPEIAPMIAAGLKLRAGRMGRILILVCENGRSPDGKDPAQILRHELEKWGHVALPTDLVILPRVVVDCAVPSLPRPSEPISISEGALWIEKLSGVQEVFLKPSYVTLCSTEDIAIRHTSKLYGYNSLHCILSVLGHYAGERYVHRVATDLNLQSPLERIVEDLVNAVCRRHQITAGSDQATIVRAYGREALKRLQLFGSRGEFDLITRSLRKVANGLYLRDGRIEGPIADLGLFERPWECPHLVHALALCLKYFVDRIEIEHSSLPWLPGEQRLPIGQSHERSAPTVLDVSVHSILHPSMDHHPLMEVLAEDTLELGASARGASMAARDIAEFLNNPIDRDLKVVPKRVTDLKCVVFDLDEGLVATESILYSVTRELIDQYAEDKRTITQDDYASYVGTSEENFFNHMVREHQIRALSVDQLIKEREARYRKRLESMEGESLVKPGFRGILQMLMRRNIKLALSSNASRDRVDATLQHVGLASYFDFIVSPNRSLRAKPAPDMLQTILAKFNIQASGCIVVESSTVGVQAARRAGCYCILLMNDYTSPKPVKRRGVEVLGNSQALSVRFQDYFST